MYKFIELQLIIMIANIEVGRDLLNFLIGYEFFIKKTPKYMIIKANYSLKNDLLDLYGEYSNIEIKDSLYNNEVCLVITWIIL